MIRMIMMVAVLALAGCGFSPMYGSAAGGSGLNAPAGLDRVDIALIPDQSGVFLRNILIDQFYRNGFPSAPDYTLKVEKIQEYETDLYVTSDSEATRKQIRLVTNMFLINNGDGKVLLNRKLVAVTSYNVLGSQFTTRVSEADAKEAALSDLARQIESQTVLYFKR